MRKGLVVVAGAVLALGLLLVSCSSPQSTSSSGASSLSGRISISGAFALYPLTVKWAEEFKKIHPDVQVDISAGGAGKGMTDALSGMVDLAMMSRSISPEEIAKGAFALAVAKDAVLPVYNSSNPASSYIDVHGFTRGDFTKVFLGKEPVSWGQLCKSADANTINAYTRSDACGAGAMWALYLGSDQENLQGVGVFGDPGIADAVKKDINALGYNNLTYVYDLKTKQPYPGVKVVKLDVNGNGIIDQNEDVYASLDTLIHAINKGIYPSPPARDLYLVSKGKPQSKLLTEFLAFVLTKGQAFVADAGYVSLGDTLLNIEKSRLGVHPE